MNAARPCRATLRAVTLSAAVVATPVGASSAAQSPIAATLAIERVTVLPMDRDIAMVDHTILVSGDRIAWIGPSRDARIPAGARRVDGRGAFVIPGLADMHVHLGSVQDLARLVDAGITTVRNMRGDPRHLAWRDSVARGTLVGPTIFTSGPSLRGARRFGRADSNFAHVRTPRDADEIVRRQAAAGYDMIKVLYGLSLEEYRQVLATARRVRIPVVGHVISAAGLERSLAGGQISFEHAYNLHERSRLASILGEDPAREDRDGRAIARAGAWVGTIASSRDGDCAPQPERLRAIIASLRRANVRLLAGTDAGIGPVQAGASLHCELRTLVAAGLTPYEAMTTATVNAGAFARSHLARSQIPFGTVEVGSRADLVLLATDPRADIEALARPVGVVLRGHWRPHRPAGE
jgi:imidazolonepropionase-like amidohydrolase